MEQAGLTGKRIIVADDEEFVRIHMSRRLRTLGLTVVEAATGRQVLQNMSPLPDLILMDVLMPDGNGFETTRIIKSQPLTSGIPIILLSALADDADIQYGLMAGADDFLCKPVPFSDIIKAITGKIRFFQISQ